jgi:hypothetical protein
LQTTLLGIGFTLLIAISAATILLANRAFTDAGILAKTLSFQDKLSNLLLSVRRAESGQRGYLFVNETRYLDDFNAAVPEGRELIAELRDAAKGNPEREGLLARVSELTEAKFKELNESIALNQSGRREDARNLVLSGNGSRIMEDLRKSVDAGLAEEARLVGVRTSQSKRTNDLLLIVTLSGAVLIVVIGVVSIMLVQRNARQLERARDELAGTNANLERIVAYRTADLTEANEEIQRFAYIVSHDLRSPLVNIMGFTSELEALRKDIFAQIEKLKADLALLSAAAAMEGADVEQLGQDFDEAIRFIKSSIGNMDRLINAVLKLSREGRRQFMPETINVKELFESISQTVAHRAGEMGANLIIGELPAVESDRLALEQIFANLVDNALKYGRPEEPLRIEINGRVSATQAIYEVKDNGRGIDPRDHQRVFELFRRAGTQDRPGEGIGLAHVRALLRRLGGSTGLTSDLGKGSTFTVTLPRRWPGEIRRVA